MTDTCPTGSIIMWGGSGSDIPDGYLVCDGTKYDKEKYAALAKCIGNNFGIADSSQFYVPDLRGRFIRGVDDTPGDTGRDPDRKDRKDMQNPNLKAPSQVGSIQSDSFKSHDHKINKGDFGVHCRSFEGKSDGNDGNPFETKGGGSTTIGGTEVCGGKETRPTNAYLYYIIKT